MLGIGTSPPATSDAGAAQDRPAELDREEGIPAGAGGDPAQRRAGEGMVKVRREEPAHRIESDRTDVDPLVRETDERPVETGRRIRPFVDPPGEEEQDGVAVETTDRETEGLGRRRIEPLDVVDGDDDTALGRQRAQVFRQATATARASGFGPSGSARRRATRSAWRCGIGRPASASSGTDSRRSPRPA